MKKDDIIGRIIALVHAEVQSITPNSDLVAEGLANAPARTSILEKMVSDVSKDSPDGLVDLMEVLNDRRPDVVYPEVRLLQQWQNMSILDTPMDNYYTADLLFSKQRAGMTLSDEEIKGLGSIANINTQHPWPLTATLDYIDYDGDYMEQDVPTTIDNPAVENDTTLTPVAVQTLDKSQEKVKTTPVASYQERRSMIEDLALANGVAMFSGREWRDAKMPRTQALLVSDFYFATIDKEGVGRAAYLLVGPSVNSDVRIELKSQSTSGSAGDKLPTSLLRLVNAGKSQSYGSAVIGVVGLQYFAPEALTLAREVASRSSRIRLVEGTENFIDAIQQSITNVKALYPSATPTVSAVQAPVATPTSATVSQIDEATWSGPAVYAPLSNMDESVWGGPASYS